jgi:hypothetical protein
MADIDYAARVAKGVALLDEEMPGWAARIDLDVLDIQSGTKCVTAQLSRTNDWRAGMDQLDLTAGDDGTYVAHGFDTEAGCDCCSSDETLSRLPEGYDRDYAYVTLNRLWRDVIEARQATPVTA